jgi:hypothetical protein
LFTASVVGAATVAEGVASIACVLGDVATEGVVDGID